MPVSPLTPPPPPPPPKSAPASPSPSASVPWPEILCTATGENWISLAPPAAPTPEATDAYQQLMGRVQRQLSDILLSENLIILTGLGTSLCVKDGKGASLAPGMGDLWNAAEKLTKDALKSLCVNVHYDIAKRNIESLLSQCHLSEQLNPDPEVSSFVADAEKMIVARCRFIDDSIKLPIHEAFLRRVGRRSTRLPRLKLFTTNYDLCFEKAASATKFVVIDGFSHTQPQDFDGSYYNFDLVRRHQDREVPDFIPNVFHLYKLHGSVDWKRHNDQILRDDKADRPLLIFPRENKFQLSYDQPFLEMMARLQMALRQPNTGLLIVGFGFNDHHIAQPILSALKSNVSLKAAIVSPGLKGSSNDIHKEVESLIQQGDSRLALFAATFETLLPLIPALVAQSEEERHQDRLSRRAGRA